ncbi:hypothetical protein LCGC14_2722320 [marine sediment metagenome]|uniref:Uncharacterized protein n=1 Tax=marine sediment metagenome TaxID=412755 RepID=A0A0F8ZXC5_9ZZZZ
MSYTIRDLAPIAIMIVVAAIVITVGSSVLQQIKTQQQGSGRGTAVANESILFTANDTYYSVAFMPISSLGSIANATKIVNSANYTFNDQLGVKVYGGAGDPLVPGTYNVSYRYLVSLNTTTKGLEAMQELGDWLPTIALIAAAVIVIGTIVVYFGKEQFG